MQLLRIISILENQEFISLAIRRLQSTDEKMKDAVIEVMDTLSYGNVIKMLLPLVDDKPEKEKRAFVKENFKEYIVSSTMNILKELIDDEEWIKIISIYTMGELKNEDFILQLAKFANSENDLLREVAIESLSKIKTIRSRLVLKEKINDLNVTIRNIVQTNLQPDPLD